MGLRPIFEKELIIKNRSRVFIVPGTIVRIEIIKVQLKIVKR